MGTSSSKPESGHTPEKLSTSPQPPRSPPSNTEPAGAPTTSTDIFSSLESDGLRPKYPKFIYNGACALTIGCPLVALLPPRRIDLSTFGLSICWFLSTGLVLEQNTGKGLMWHVGSRIPSRANSERREQEKIEEGRRQAMRARDARNYQEESKILQAVREQEIKLEEVQRRAREKKRGLIRKAWMGDEPDDWIERRKQREERELNAGRGYGGLIADQIREVMGFKIDSDEDEDEDEDNRDEKASLQPTNPHGNGDS